jgi:hypothetical protein
MVRGAMIRLPTRESVFGSACSFVGNLARPLGLALARPVFIIGTGRCGTSLLVRILDSHPDITGYPGEANELWHPKLEPFESSSIDIPPIEVDPRNFSDVSMATWPEGHAGRIRRTFAGYWLLRGLPKVFFAKSAMISFMIPRILEVFPRARFIHIYRYGPSVVESYFEKNFGKYSRYKFEEEEYRLVCARYWNECILEIEKRRKEWPLSADGSFIEFSYEELCDRPKSVLERIGDFLGVDAEGFAFDLSKIANRNRSTAVRDEDPGYGMMIAAMSSGMELKDYSHEWPPLRVQPIGAVSQTDGVAG